MLTNHFLLQLQQALLEQGYDKVKLRRVEQSELVELTVFTGESSSKFWLEPTAKADRVNMKYTFWTNPVDFACIEDLARAMQKKDELQAPPHPDFRQFTGKP